MVLFAESKRACILALASVTLFTGFSSFTADVPELCITTLLQAVPRTWVQVPNSAERDQERRYNLLVKGLREALARSANE